MMRTGLGVDSHRFCDGDHVVIGGVRIPYDKGVSAHSDGDVLLHAIIDALLGALALGDIGQHFPDTDEQYQNADSIALLQRVYELIEAKGYQLVNLDSVVICEAPKLSSHINNMREVIATTLKVEQDAISVKATTNERMGFIGRGEGLAAQAIVNVIKFR